MTAEPSARRAVPWRALLALLALGSVLLVALLPSPYAIERPGPVFDALGRAETKGTPTPLIDVPGRTTYPTSGSLDVLTVSVIGTPTAGPPWVDLAAAWLDPAQSVVPLEAVYPAGQTLGDADRQGAEQMTAAQQGAIAAALTRLGYPVRGTVRVTQVQPGTAAAGRLKAGDVVHSFAGRPVIDSCSLQDLVLSHGTAPSAVDLQRAGATTSVQVTPRLTAVGGGKRPLLGVVTSSSYTFPFPVRLRLNDVSGPSAGMMFALGIVDKLTPGALTGGRSVAGTGTICGDGAVGAIGGIAQKMVAARRAGATVFLAPASNCDEVLGHVPDGLDVY
ncbi:MAG: Lon-like protease, partial [Microbacteriaceae bacterium]|nr:Lon-like protease [Microbacteriaceae bacterium]